MGVSANTNVAENDIKALLTGSRELARFCDQNGWIDDDTLRYEIVEQQKDHLLLNVYFTEIAMEGSGCVADRLARYGRVRIDLDQDGKPIKLTLC